MCFGKVHAEAIRSAKVKKKKKSQVAVKNSNEVDKIRSDKTIQVLS